MRRIVESTKGREAAGTYGVVGALVDWRMDELGVSGFAKRDDER